MSTALKFDTANIRDIAFAKVGNKLNGEELLFSNDLCALSGEYEEVLTEALLKKFKNLERQVFFNADSLELNTVFKSSQSLFGLQGNLIDEAKVMATHMYENISHAKTKGGDLCIASIDDVDLGGALCKALCVIKSETSIPVLEISENDSGVLDLKARNVISPDKLQSGVLIVDYQEKSGFAVYSFDKSRDETCFWNRVFLSVKPPLNEEFMTKRYTEMAVAFTQEEFQDDSLDQADRFQLASQAMSYFDENDDFDIDRFENTAFGDNNEMKEQFQSFKEHFKDDENTPLDTKFSIAKPIAQKASKKVKGVMTLDNGASITFKPQFAENMEGALEKGYDEKRQMKFVTVYYNEEV